MTQPIMQPTLYRETIVDTVSASYAWGCLSSEVALDSINNFELRTPYLDAHSVGEIMRRDDASHKALIIS
jgi:hypothetical protein